MAGLTITDAAQAWGVHRDTVRHWLRDGKIEGTKGNDGVWRVAEGQQPPPGGELRRAQGDRLRSSEDGPGLDDPGSSTDDPGAAELSQRLAAAERDLVVTRRELELAHERHREALAAAEAVAHAKAEASERVIAMLEADRDRLVGLLRKALERPPTLLERILMALWGARSAVPGVEAPR
jgi:excisionase family DNA binding protein